MMAQVWIAYVLWLMSGFGALGFHRFYLGKIPTGILWMFTGGLGMVGSIYDFFTLRGQVEQANFRRGFLGSPQSIEVHHTREKPPLERVILNLAQQNSGRVTAAQVAAGSDWTVDQAQKELDNLVRRNVCELRVLKSGTVVYHFAEFDPASSQEFEV
ncbi:MAG: TM2 domain-containing protein [Spirochaetales bacterium]